MHDFDTAIRLEPQGDDRYAGRTTPAYANMVGPFGGVTAACLLQAPLQHPARLGDPVALTVNFAVGLADGAFEIGARPVRTNRSTQHWSIELTQDGQVAATASAVFAKRRATWSAPEAAPPAGLAAAETLAPARREFAPPWTARYDMRFAHGALPLENDGAEQADSLTHVWVRDEPPRPLDFASLAALCDSFFPRIFVRRRRFVPIGTVTLTTYFHADAARLAAQGDGHVLGSARALAFRDGYFDQTATVWSRAGELLASSHQLVYYRE